MKHLVMIIIYLTVMGGSLIAQNTKQEFASVLMYRLDSAVIQLDDGIDTINGSKYEYYYNDELMMNSLIYNDWWEGNWWPERKEEHFFNDNNLTTSIIYYEYTENNWQQYYKREMQYNPDGTLQFQYIFLWDLTSWEESDMIEYSYGNDTITETWYDKENNQWIPGGKVESIYNDGKLVLEIRSSIDSESGEIYNQIKVSLEYSEGNLSLKLFYFWNGQDWGIPLEKHIYNYDSFNNMVLYNSYTWKIDLEEWRFKKEVTQIYNNDFTNGVLIIPQMCDSMDYRHMMIGGTSLSIGSIYKELLTNYYTPVIIDNINSVNDIKAVVYPNPATEYLSISLDKSVPASSLTIFNSTGKIVAQIEITKEAAIQVGNFGNGIFFYTLTNKGTFLGSGKFIVN